MGEVLNPDVPAPYRGVDDYYLVKDTTSGVLFRAYTRPVTGRGDKYVLVAEPPLDAQYWGLHRVDPNELLPPGASTCPRS